MKRLKLDHELANLVRQGVKTSTWRMFDDKDVSVGDSIELIDKVDPKDERSWQLVATANVVKVIEKPLRAITESDFEGHEEFASQDAMLEAYQKYYGPKVTPDTSIKMIHFKLQD